MPFAAMTSDRVCAGHPSARTPRTAWQNAGSGLDLHQGSAGAVRAVGADCADVTLVTHSTPNVVPSANNSNRSIAVSSRAITMPSVFELVQQPDTATRIVFRRRSLGRRGAVAQAALELQMFGQVHIDFDLRESRGALLCTDEYATGDVTARLDGCSRALGALGTRITTAADRQPVQA